MTSTALSSRFDDETATGRKPASAKLSPGRGRGGADSFPPIWLGASTSATAYPNHKPEDESGLSRDTRLSSSHQEFRDTNICIKRLQSNQDITSSDIHICLSAHLAQPPHDRNSWPSLGLWQSTKPLNLQSDWLILGPNFTQWSPDVDVDQLPRHILLIPYQLNAWTLEFNHWTVAWYDRVESTLRHYDPVDDPMNDGWPELMLGDWVRQKGLLDVSCTEAETSKIKFSAEVSRHAGPSAYWHILIFKYRHAQSFQMLKATVGSLPLI